MDKFLEKHNLPKLNEEEAESLNRMITAGEIEAVIKKSPGTQKPWTRLQSLAGEFYKTFKEELTPILLRLFQKIQEDRRLPSSFYEANITLVPKLDKDTTKKEKYRPILLMKTGAKIFN